MKDKGTY
jgi:hypothetical protein